MKPRGVGGVADSLFDELVKPKSALTLNNCFTLALDVKHVDEKGNGLVLLAICNHCEHVERMATSGAPGSRVPIPEEFRTKLLEHRATHERPS